MSSGEPGGSSGTTDAGPPALDVLWFLVHGQPRPQGSKRAFVVGGKAVLTESAGAPLKAWRSDVRDAAREALGDRGTLEGGVAVLVEFYLEPPKRRPKDRPYPSVRPDLDKLARALLDAIGSAGVWRDDAQVVDLTLRKRYAEEGEGPSVAAAVWRMA